MAATTQTHVDTLHAQIVADGTLSNAVKAQVQSHLYSISQILFGSNAGTGVATTIGGKSGKVDGCLG
jgi:hypothetical protein